MNAAGKTGTDQCLLCSKEKTDAQALNALVEEARQWLKLRLHINDEPNACTNIKQMLDEACEYTEAVLDSVPRGNRSSSYSNLRGLIERAHVARSLLCWDDPSKPFNETEGWEARGMAGVYHHPQLPKDQQAIIRQWYGETSGNGKPKQMKGKEKYDTGIPRMPPSMYEAYQMCSGWLHPNFRGPQNVGRKLSPEEAEWLIGAAHEMFCLTKVAAWVAHAYTPAFVLEMMYGPLESFDGKNQRG